MSLENELEDYLWGKTEGSDYLKKAAECDNSVLIALKRNVEGLNETLDKQLRKGVESNLARLLEQVPTLQGLEDTLHTVQDRMKSVALESKRLATGCDDLLTKMRQQTKEIEVTRKMRNLAEDAVRCEELFDSFEKRSDNVKKAEIIAEIKEIVKEDEDLLKFQWLKNLVEVKLKHAENETRRSTVEDLKRGLTSLNTSLVSSSMRGLRTLTYLDAELEVLMSSSVVELDKKFMELANLPAENVNKQLPLTVGLVQTHLEQSAMLGDAYRKKFSERLARLIRTRVALDAPFALRLVQQLGRLFNARAEGCSPALLDSLRPMKNALLSHSLARLHAIVEDHDFSLPHANAFVDLINAAMEEELNKVEWDVELSKKARGNMEKCIEMIGKKMEQNLHLQTADLLLGERLTANQMTNYRLIQTADGILKRWPDESKSILGVQQEALTCIVSELKNFVRAIVSRMHIEKRGAKSVAPYMQELLVYVKNVDMHMAHFSRAACYPEVLSQISDAVIDLFLLNVTLLRTENEDERQFIITDFSRLLEAIRAMEWPSKYGDTTRLLNIFNDDLRVASIEGVRKSLLIHLLISSSPKELMSPHQSVDWSLEEYTKWYEEHTEEDVLALLNGLISSYASSVIAQNRQEYVPNYPTIVGLLTSQ